ncbi:glycoside hydrolase family 28 protein [Marinicrinis lubricantis]|uniref:Glycoside hydrolase family 28 protein n=1 Tax=Marinicrinis lubricantis TaxID=2086470 RepID=A0ABW1IVD7_9BACL
MKQETHESKQYLGMDMPEVQLPSIPDRSVNIQDFGAVGDGFHNNTKAIEDAISHLSSLGGGRVIIPAGVWLTGPIVFQNAIELYTEQGALVLFSKNFDDYPLIMSHYEGRRTVRCRSPLDAEGVEHIAITGHGIFDGGGDAWRHVKKDKLTERAWQNLVASGGVVDERGRIWYPTEASLNGQKLVEQLHREGITDIEAYKPARDFLRPCLLSFRYCKRILLEGPTFQNSPSWCLHPWACEHITIRNVNVRNPWYAQNGDGLDLDSCQYAVVENSTFDVGDDAICLKSGKNKEGRDFGRPSEFISVRNCVVYHGHGGIVVGSEMSGGVRNVHVENCTFLGTDIGIRFKSCRGRGGVVENIAIKKIRMSEIAGDAISFNLYYEGRSGSGEYGEEKAEAVTEETPIFRNIYIDDVICKGAKKALLINGLPEMPIENLTLQHVSIESEEGIVCRNANTLDLSDVYVSSKTGPAAVFHQCEAANLRQMKLFAEQVENQVIHVSGDRTSRIECSELSPDIKLIVSKEVQEDVIVKA